MAIVVFQVMRLTAVRSSQDVGQGIERWSQVIGMCGVSALLAYFTKSTGHDDYWADLSALNRLEVYIYSTIYFNITIIYLYI